MVTQAERNPAVRSTTPFEQSVRPLVSAPEPQALIDKDKPHPLDNPVARQRILDNGPDPKLDPEGAVRHREAVARVFDEDGRWILRGNPGMYPNLWDAAPELVQRALALELKPVYDLVDFNLRGEKWPHGYNRHDLEHHVLVVYEQADKLLDDAGYKRDKRVKRINAVAALGHDNQNVNSRVDHGPLAPVGVSTVVPDVLSDPEQWEVATQAMELHEEKQLLKYLNGSVDTPEQAILVIRSLGPNLAALVLADKLGRSIDRDRVNKWARTMHTINSDRHMWSHYLARGIGVELSWDGSELRSIVEFNPAIVEDEVSEFAEVVRPRDHHEPNTYRARVPDAIQEIYLEHGVPHFYSWGGNLMSIFLPRIKLSALCAKALFPQIQRFVFELRDERGTRSQGRGEVVEKIFFDGHLAEQFAQLDTIYPKREEPNGNGNGNGSHLLSGVSH